MKRNELSEYLAVIKRIETARESLKTLKISWETDINKIDITKPINGKFFSEKILFRPKKVTMMPIEPYPSTLDYNLYLFPNVSTSIRFLNLIDLITSGERIVPPLLRTNVTIKDGVECNGESYICDGGHRLTLSRVLGLKEVPVTNGDVITSHQFSPDKWCFFEKEDGVLIKSLFNEKEYKFNYNEYALNRNQCKYVEVQPILNI